MSFETYKVLHITGILLIFTGLAGLWGVSTFYPVQKFPSPRIPLALIHGIGMSLALVTGFGLLARLGLTESPPLWVWLKILVWFSLGMSLMLAKRRAHKWGAKLIVLWVILGSFAAWLALTKPF